MSAALPDDLGASDDGDTPGEVEDMKTNEDLERKIDESELEFPINSRFHLIPALGLSCRYL